MIGILVIAKGQPYLGPDGGSMRHSRKFNKLIPVGR
jgi:hypothetical protein